MTCLLVLRPEPGAGVTIAKARRLGLNAIAAPLFKIEASAWHAPDAAEFDGLLLTSANAIRFGGIQLGQYRSLGVYAVGEATAAAARKAGFEVAGTGNSGIGPLLHSIPPNLRLLHLCGEHRREAQDAPQRISTRVVYRSVEIERPDVAVAAGNVVLVHSPRAAKRFAQLVGKRDEISVAAISSAAAMVLGPGWRSVSVADRPTDDALLALAARLCNKDQRR